MQNDQAVAGYGGRKDAYFPLSVRGKAGSFCLDTKGTKKSRLSEGALATWPRAFAISTRLLLAITVFCCWFFLLAGNKLGASTSMAHY